MSTSLEQTDDLLGQVAQIAPDSVLGQLRAQRSDLVQQAQQAYDALFTPKDAAGVPQAERELIGLRSALNVKSSALAEHYRQRLLALGSSNAKLEAIEQFPQPSSDLSPREVALLQHIDLLSFSPAQAQASDLEPLRAHGFSERDCVIVTQLIGFVNFQSRISHGLRALGETKN
jgi:CMD domain protein